MCIQSIARHPPSIKLCFPPPKPVVHRQKMWGYPRVCAIAQVLTDETQDARSRARLFAASRSESVAWLLALPSPNLGLRIDDETVQMAVGLRFGTPLYQPHKCSHFTLEVDTHSTHSLSCWWSEGKYPHHAAVNDIVHKSLTLANLPFRFEHSELYRSDGKHPNSCSILPWRCGKVLVCDTTCPDTHAPSNVLAAGRGASIVTA